MTWNQTRRNVARARQGLSFSTFALMSAIAVPSTAIDWDDAGNSASKLWSDFGNWNPDGSPQNQPVNIGNLANAANDTTIYDLPGVQINSLTLSNGADVDTNGNELIVNGVTTLGGSSTQLIVRNNGGVDSFDTNELIVNSGGTVSMFNGRLEVDSSLIDLNNGGTIIGSGLIDLEGADVTATNVFSNDGTLTANTAPIFIGGSPAPGTLQVRALGANAANARFDWDGLVPITAVLQVNGNQTLDIDVQPNDAYSGTINLNTGGTIDIANSWELDTGTINVNTGAFGLIIIGQDPNPGPGAHIDGANWTMSGGNVVIADTWDTLILDSNVTVSDGTWDIDGDLEINSNLDATGGTFDLDGNMVVNGTADFEVGADLNVSSGTNTLTVNGTVTIDQPVFDWDGLNSVTVNDGALLDINSPDIDTAADPDGYDGSTFINGGTLRKDGGAWVFEGVFNMDTSASDSDVSGSQMTIGAGAATINVTGTGNADADINSAVIVDNTLDVNVAAGTALDFGSIIINTTSTTWDGGAGSILRNGTATINAVTTYNFSGGTVDLDDGNDTLNAQLTVNAASIDVSSDGIDGTLTINNSGALIVNLDGNATWQMDGTLTYNGDASPGTVIGGSSAVEFQPTSTFNMNGDGNMVARAIFEGAVNINDAAEEIELFGGNLTPGSTNEINGATINGPGTLAIDSGQALRGNGTINAPVRGDSTSQLIAQDGLLNVNGGFGVGMGRIGTSGGAAVLNITDPWNTNIATSVILDGGRLQGSTVTNDLASGINGTGDIIARVINNTTIDAEGGSLSVSHTLNDWDGTTNNGQLRAITGDLKISDNATFLFNGTVQANAGRVVTVTGFELEFDPASNLILNGGTYEGDVATDIGGTVTVNAGTSNLAVSGTTVFEASSNTTLNGNLRLNNTATNILSGATFAGGGALINVNNRSLNLANGADVDVLLDNQGNMNIGGTGDGQVTGADFQQAASGTLNIDLGGTALNAYDRYNLTGASSLNGELDVDLIGGFNPVAGDAFGILSAVGGVFGTFASLDLPALDPGLIWSVDYGATLVTLEVLAGIAGDYNGSGQVEQGDLDLVLGNWGNSVPPIPGGWVNDLPSGLIDQDELDGVLLNWGNTAAPDFSGSAVPEPTTAALLALGGLTLRRRRPAA